MGIYIKMLVKDMIFYNIFIVFLTKAFHKIFFYKADKTLRIFYVGITINLLEI